MDYKRDREHGKGTRTIRMGVKDVGLRRIPVKYLEKLKRAETEDSPTQIAYAWAAILDPAQGGLELTLGSEREDDHDEDKMGVEPPSMDLFPNGGGHDDP